VGAAPPGRQDLNGRCLRAEFGPDTLRAANRLTDGQQTYASEVNKTITTLRKGLKRLVAFLALGNQ
jgi:hypothetical protein